MTISYFPFDAGAGADVTEAQWRKMAQFWMGTGVLRGELNGFQVVQHGAGTMQVDMNTGKAWIMGHYVESDATEVLTIAANSSGNGRIDLVVMRADFAANTIGPVVLQGTPAGSPVAPALTQTTARWEIPLAEVAVADGATSILTANITDARVYAKRFDYDEVWGLITTGGAVSSGKGFTSVKTSTGSYTVTFDEEFAVIPAVIPSIQGLDGSNNAKRVFAYPQTVSVTGFTIIFVDVVGTLQDVSWHFIARSALA